MNWKKKLVYLASLVTMLVCGGLTGSVTVSANTPYQTVVSANQNDNNGNNSNNDNDGDDHSGGYVPDGGNGDQGGYVPGRNGTIGGGIAPGSTTTGATAGATASNGVGAATTATNSQNINAYGNANKQNIAGQNGSSSAKNFDTSKKQSNPSRNVASNNNISKNSTSTNQRKGANVTNNESSKPDYSYIDHRNSFKNESNEYNGKLQTYLRARHSGQGHGHHKTTWRKGQHLSKRQRNEYNYMKKHQKNYNHNYPRFAADCTNYASQLALHGGWKKTKRGKEKWHIIHGYRCSDKNKWYSGKYRVKTWHGKSWFKHKVYTTSWTTVNGFWHFATKTKHHKHFTTKSVSKIIRNARFGDVVQFQDHEGNHNSLVWTHTVTISKVTKNAVYYTSHVADHLHKSMSHANNGRTGKYKWTSYRLIRMGIQ